MGRLSAAWPDMFKALATSFHFGEDAVDARGPYVGNRFVIPRRKELIDCALEFVDAAKDPTPDGLLFELREPAFDEIEPTGTGWDKVQHEAGALAQPSADARVAMKRIRSDLRHCEPSADTHSVGRR